MVTGGPDPRYIYIYCKDHGFWLNFPDHVRLAEAEAFDLDLFNKSTLSFKYPKLCGFKDFVCSNLTKIFQRVETTT